MRTLRRALAAVAAGAMALGGAVAVAGPAQAAPVACTYTKTVYVSGSYTVRYPSHPSIGSNCQQWYTSPTQEGDRIKWLQRSLNGCYRTSLVVDGKYGPKTRDAVRQVQAQIGITVDGYYGPTTAKLMKHGRFRPGAVVPAYCGSWLG